MKKSLTAGILAVIFLVAVIAGFALAPGLVSAAGDSGEKYFTILHTNDEHSALIPHAPAVDYRPATDNPAVGGIARLAGAVKAIREQKRAAGEQVVLISGGDFTKGTPFGWLALEEEAPELKLMQQIGYDVVTIGNHEYDFGPENLGRYLQAAGYPQAHQKTVVLATNTNPPDDHPLAEAGLRATHIITLDNGLKLGFFGLIGEDARSVAQNTDPVEFGDQYDTAAAAVEELTVSGADVIIAVTHLGVAEDKLLAQKVPGIHVIVGGHSHDDLSEPVIAGETIIVQSGSLMEFLGIAELAYNPENNSVRLRNAEQGTPSLLPVADFPAEEEISLQLKDYEDKVNLLINSFTGGRFQSIYDSVARSEFPVPNTPELQETPFANLVTDAMRIVTGAKTGVPVDFAFQFNGQIRGGIEPGTMPYSKGLVSFYDLAELVGLGTGLDGSPGYPIVAFYLTGEEVRRVLEVAALLEVLEGDTYYLQASGLRYSYDPDRAVLLQVPVLDLPIPTTRAVLSAERFTGDGSEPQTNLASYVPLERGDETLYRVATDHYILSFLPMAGELLPQLTIVPRDSSGEPIENLDETVVTMDGRELKVWGALAEYVAAQPPGVDGLPQIPEYYSSPSGRINKVNTMPLIIWPLLGLAVMIALIVYLVRRRRKRKLNASA